MEYVPFLRFRTEVPQVAVAVSAVMLVFGLICLLYGWKIYKALLIISFGLVTGYIGWFFLRQYAPENYRFLVPVVTGLLGALVAIPVQNAVVFLLGASIGFVSLGPVAADLIWHAPNGPSPTQYLVAGAVAFVAMGIFALLLFRPAMIIATCMFGATLLLSAAVHIIELVSTRRQNIYGQHPLALAWIYVGLIIVGVLFQAAMISNEKKAE